MLSRILRIALIPLLMLALAYGDLHVGEGEHAVGGRHEILALDRVEQIQHFLVQHLTRPDLVLDHVETGLFDVHGSLAREGDFDGFESYHSFARRPSDACHIALRPRRAGQRLTAAPA